MYTIAASSSLFSDYLIIFVFKLRYYVLTKASIVFCTFVLLGT